MLHLRQRPLRPFLTDLSAPLTAVLFALSVPPLAPWWVAAVGMIAAIVFAKHLYGGLGFNLFNPAMVGVAVVLISFPLEMTRWLAPKAFPLRHPGSSTACGRCSPANQSEDTRAGEECVHRVRSRCERFT